MTPTSAQEQEPASCLSPPSPGLPCLGSYLHGSLRAPLLWAQAMWLPQKLSGMSQNMKPEAQAAHPGRLGPGQSCRGGATVLPCHTLRMVESVEAVSAGAHTGPQPPALAGDRPRPGGVSTKPASMRDPQEAEKQRSVPTDGTESTAPEWLLLPPPPPRTCQDLGLKSPQPRPCLPEDRSEAA